MTRRATLGSSGSQLSDELCDFVEVDDDLSSSSGGGDESHGRFLEYQPTLSRRLQIDPLKLVFLDDSLEQRWSEIMCRQNVGRGARILLALNAVIFAATLGLYLLKRRLCNVDKQVVFFGSTNHVLNVSFGLGSSVLLVISLKTLNKHVYLLVVAAYTVCSCLLALPVLAQPCEQVRPFMKCEGDLDDSDVFANCDLKAFTYMQEMMVWGLLTPWVIPEYRMMRYTWLWVWLFFLTASAHPRPPGHDVDVFSEAFDVLTCVAFLCGVNFMAIWKKRSMEKKQRTKFLVSIHEREASGEVYDILVNMLPDFVIRPMISSPGTPIADHVQRASVMFISLADFDAIAGSLQPAQLLLFLNGFFTEIDTICATHSVTKIETVGEVYVCAVGVTPDEQREDRESGHQRLLTRLARAGSDMLSLREAHDGALHGRQEVVLTIGLHTGPVVAGVVGRKLPRFRLFGDTMNLAARMMQTGAPGCMQLGEETREHLPPKVEQQLTRREAIEMKGVGLKTTYLLGCWSGSPDSPHWATSLRSARSPQDASPHAADLRRYLTPTRKITGKVMKGLAAAVVGVLSPEEHMTKFDQVVSDVSASMSTHSTPVISVEAEEDRRFYQWFHSAIFFQNIDQRLRRQEIFLAALASAETIFNLFIMIGYDSLPDLWRSLLQLKWFLACRAVCLALLGFWYLYSAKKSSSSMAANGGLLQRLLLYSNCIVAALMFISYDLSPNILHPTINQTAFRTSPISGISRNLHSLVCFPVYGLVTTAHQFLLRGSLAFLLVAMALVQADSFGWLGNGLVLPDLGRLIFILAALMQVFEAYFEEASFRGQFKAQCALDVARHRIEGVLDRLMPPLVIQELRNNVGMGPLAHPYADATVLQADLCGFTKLARTRKPTEVVQMIGEIFGLFDRQADKHQVYKVETVGDAYIAGQAGPPLSLHKSPMSVIRLGLDIVRKLQRWSASKNEDVGCRVGVHTGECIGGIVGTTMQRYHLFGELMTRVDILESTSREGQVQVSSACRAAAEAEASEFDEWQDNISFSLRSDPTLRTSKGYEFPYERVGGPTYFARRSGHDASGGPASASEEEDDSSTV